MTLSLTVRLDDEPAADTGALARAEGQSLDETVKIALRETIERRREDPKFKAACVASSSRTGRFWSGWPTDFAIQ